MLGRKSSSGIAPASRSPDTLSATSFTTIFSSGSSISGSESYD